MSTDDASATGNSSRRTFLRKLALASAGAASTAASFDLSAATPARRSDARLWAATTDVLSDGPGAPGLAATIRARRAHFHAMVTETLTLPGGSSSQRWAVGSCGGDQ